jgi:SAM-dependent methyltransferase
MIINRIIIVNSKHTMIQYYSKRAEEYEKIYHRNDPVRQKEQDQIKSDIMRIFTCKSVLEIACGTGYWTKYIAEVAESVTGIDASDDVLKIAESKNIKADFINCDAFSLEKVHGKFNAGCANFWFSHLNKKDIDRFLSGFHGKLLKNSSVFIADNVYVEGIGGELSGKDDNGNTYKQRKLLDGSSHRIIKNYYNEQELRGIFMKYSKDIDVRIGMCFWRVTYVI